LRRRGGLWLSGKNCVGIMSKKKRGKKFRKRNEKAELLLAKLARVLDECDSSLLNIKLRHGIVMSSYGYVFPSEPKWSVRMLVDPGFPFNDNFDDD
jgi:hypothetical protein